MNPFTLTELFGWFVAMPTNPRMGWTIPVGCQECGAAVTYPDLHAQWHNKVADL